MNIFLTEKSVDLPKINKNYNFLIQEHFLFFWLGDPLELSCYPFRQLNEKDFSNLDLNI
jgi:hypothetical protein